MDEKQLKILKKRMFLDFMLAKLFDVGPDLTKQLEDQINKNKAADPFAPVPPEQIPEIKPGMVKFNSKGIERFTALKNKTLAKAEENKQETEVQNAET